MQWVQISSFLDENSHAHTLLPQDIDQLLSQASEHLKGHATIDMASMKNSTKYRGSKMGHATQAKSGMADAAPAPTASSGGLGSEAGGLSSEIGGGGFQPGEGLSSGLGGALGASGGGKAGSGSSGNFQNYAQKDAR